MRKFLLASSLTVLAVAPATARDGAGYFGVGGGLLFPKDNKADIIVDFTTTQTPATPLAPAGPVDVTQTDAIGIDYRRGYDLDAVAGYDFGLIRAEVELGFKQAKVSGYDIDAAALASLSTALNRPSAAPDPFAPGLGVVVVDPDVGGRIRILSGMVNAFIDLGRDDGLSFYAGGGFGRARVKLLGNRDDAWAGQLIAGARYPISDNIDFGVKYRYFRTARLELRDAGTTLVQGNPDLFNQGTPSSPIFVERRTNATLDSSFEDRFASHSLLATLSFNFGGRTAELAPPPPPPMMAPPVVAPPPATQTCYDGTVVLATDICPSPPPPPPPPPPAPVRG